MLWKKSCESIHEEEKCWSADLEKIKSDSKVGFNERKYKEQMDHRKRLPLVLGRTVIVIQYGANSQIF